MFFLSQLFCLFQGSIYRYLRFTKKVGKWQTAISIHDWRTTSTGWCQINLCCKIFAHIVTWPSYYML